MNTNISLAADPFEGANTAFHVLKPHASTQDWENWVERVGECANGHFDYFAAYGSMCKNALEAKPDLEIAKVRLLSYSAGYFDGMESVIAGLIDVLPTSGRMPHHEARYRYNLLRFPERYLVEESDD